MKKIVIHCKTCGYVIFAFIDNETIKIECPSCGYINYIKKR